MACQDFSAKSLSNYLIGGYTPFGSQEVLVNRATSGFSNPADMGYCKEGVSNIERFDGGQQKKKGGQQNILKSKIMHLLTDNNTDTWYEELMRAGLGIFDSRRLWFFIHSPEFGDRVFEGMQRGNVRYCKKYRHKIIDKAESMIRRGGQLMALTVTFDAKNFTENRIKAWQDYPKLLNRLMKELRRKYKCEYISVLESTNKGYPHAHIVLGFAKGTIPYYNKLKNKTKLKYGELYETVKNFAPARKFHLEVIKGNSTAFYLVKYIAKGEKKSIFDLLKKDEHFTKDERKLLQCLLYCTACGVRQVRMSEKEYFNDTPDNAAKQSDESKTEESGTAAVDASPNHDPPAEENSTAKRWALITRCNNLPNRCLQKVYLMTQRRKTLLFGDADGEEIESDYEKLQLFKRYAAEVGCGGCFPALIASAVLTNNLNLINVTYWGKDYKRHKWFDDVDILDDEAFVDALERLITFFYAAISSHKYTASEFFGIGKCIGLNPFDLAGVTKMTKNHYKLHQNKIDQLYKLDDYERKMTARESREEIKY